LLTYGPVSTAPGVPGGHIGAVETGPYVNKGTDLKLGDLPVYVSGERGTVGIIVCQEVFGIDTHRFKRICDELAAAGFVAVIADYHRGNYVKDFSKFGAWCQATPWSKISEDLNTHIFPLLAARGCTKFGGLGFCWGSWLVLHMGPKLTAGAYCHPSHTKVAPMIGESSDELVTSFPGPILCYAAGNDGDDVKPGGHDEKLVASKPWAAKNEFKVWPDNKHGFVSRFPFEEDQVARDYPLVIAGIVAFFKKNIPTA